jgi:type I restriction enzyme S subunit
MNPEQLLQHFDRIGEAPDAIPRLRRFILDLAVRGKLVEQDQNDEPATELLKKIQAEKTLLVKSGKIKKQPELPEVSVDEQFFESPESWVWTRFGEIADFSAGRTPSRHDSSFWNTGEYPWISIADMKDGETIFKTKETISERAKTQVFSSDPVGAGTIIMSFKLTIGKIARLGVPAFHNEAIISIRPHLIALEEYLFMVLPQFSREGNTKDAIKGATLNRESITNILLPLPPLAEQHRIVAKVNELMALCDQLQAAQTEREQSRDRLVAASLHSLNPPTDDEAANNPETQREHARFLFNHLPRLTTRPGHIKQLRQTILSLAVRGKLVVQDPNDEPVSITLEKSRVQNFKRWNEDLLNRGIGGSKKCPSRYKELTEPNTKVLFALPMLWNWVCWESILAFGEGTFKRGPFGSALTKSIFVSSGYKVYEQYCPINDDCSFARYYITPEKFKELEGFAVKAGDFLISCSGVTLGRITQVPNDYEEGVINQALLRVRTDKTLVDDAFFKMLFRSPYFQTQIFSNSMGMAIPNVKGVAELKAIPLPLPPLAEQHRIVAKVDELMALCDQLETQLTSTAADSRSLLEAILHEALLPATEQAA